MIFWEFKIRLSYIWYNSALIRPIEQLQPFGNAKRENTMRSAFQENVNKDTIGEIMGFLSPSDWNRASQVCRHWYAIAHRPVVMEKVRQNMLSGLPNWLIGKFHSTPNISLLLNSQDKVRLIAFLAARRVPAELKIVFLESLIRSLNPNSSTSVCGFLSSALFNSNSRDRFNPFSEAKKYISYNFLNQLLNGFKFSLEADEKKLGPRGLQLRQILSERRAPKRGELIAALPSELNEAKNYFMLLANNRLRLLSELAQWPLLNRVKTAYAKLKVENKWEKICFFLLNAAMILSFVLPKGHFLEIGVTLLCILQSLLVLISLGEGAWYFYQATTSQVSIKPEEMEQIVHDFKRLDDSISEEEEPYREEIVQARL